METLRAVSPLRIGDVTLVPVERTVFRTGMGDAGCWISARKDVIAVVICDAGGLRALAPDSSEIALDALVLKAPNLGAVLDGLAAS